MIFSNQDMDFVHGFVKQAYDLGASEQEASVMLSIAYPRWKASTVDKEVVESVVKAAGFAQSVKGLGKSLGGVFQHGAGSLYHGVKAPAMAAAGAIKNNPRAALGAAAAGGVAYAGKGVYDWMHRKDNFYDPAGFAGGAGGPGGSGGATGGGGNGSYDHSYYSPHGAYIQSKLNGDDAAGATYTPDGAAPAPTNTDPRAAANGGSQWDREFKAGHTDIKAHQDKAKALQEQVNNLQHSNLDPVQQQREQARLQSEIASANAAASKRQAELGKVDDTLQAQQGTYDQARANNQAIVARRMAQTQEQATNWARAQEDARKATWFLPKAYYGAKNWVTGNSPSDGDEISGDIQSLRSARNRFDTQQPNYYH